MIFLKDNHFENLCFIRNFLGSNIFEIIIIQQGDWSNGGILVSGARDIGFDSHITHFFAFYLIKK